MNLSKIPKILGLNFPGKISRNVQEGFRPFATLGPTKSNPGFQSPQYVYPVSYQTPVTYKYYIYFAFSK
jgi:hypothetical protein